MNPCPRCCGFVQLDRDQYGPYLCCVQCGWHKDLPATPSTAQDLADTLAKHKKGPRVTFPPAGVRRLGRNRRLRW